MDRYLKAPLDREEVKTLKAGDYVYITGTIYTAQRCGPSADVAGSGPGRKASY